jgi:protease II
MPHAEIQMSLSLIDKTVSLSTQIDYQDEAQPTRKSNVFPFLNLGLFSGKRAFDKIKDRNPGVDNKRKRDRFTMATEWATSHDGTAVPITLVWESDRWYRSGFETSADRCEHRPGPLLLVGYGAYGVCAPVHYDPLIYSLLRRGWIVGYSHCRGGGEFGRTWHRRGVLLNKWNTFLDFAATAEHLIARGFTRPSQMCAFGGSAGGLIMGAMANNFPQMFAALLMR